MTPLPSPPPAPVLTPAEIVQAWQRFLGACQRHELHRPGALLALRLLAAPQGVETCALPQPDVFRLGHWHRRRGWVARVLLRRTARGGRVVRYTARAGMHAVFALPAGRAPRLLACLRGWLRCLEGLNRETAAPHPMRLLSMLVSVAADPDPQGHMGVAGCDGSPYRSKDLNYRPLWQRLVSLGLLRDSRRLATDPRRAAGRYHLTAHGRKVLGLPALPAAPAAHPYRNASAA